MSMEEKNEYVVNYINSIKDSFESSGHPISDETVSRVTNQYLNSNKSFEEIKEEIDKLVEQKLEELKRQQEFIEKMKQEMENKRIDALNQNQAGITLNEQRIKNGQEPIETLHGGFYNNDMTDKKRKEKFQDFNYHTHTYRSGHSEYVSDEDILKSAKQAGISMLGFSEHVPNPDLEFPDEDHRMLLSEVDGYVASINKMKQENPDMTILSGFEAEFDPMKEAFLGEMREKVDYIILGQHFVKNGMQLVQQEGNPNYPLEYAQMVCKGIESGLFDIVAHPDCFMESRDTISDENKAAFEENCIKASHMICQKATEMGIPIEINMGNTIINKFLNDGNLGIPHPLFWGIAKEYDVKVLKGIDAHSLSAFENLDKGQELIANIEQMVSDKIIKGPYNPVVARKNNPKLQEAYKSHQAVALTYETHMIRQIVNGTLANVGDELDSDSLASAVETSLNGVIQRCVDGADIKDKFTVDEISKIADSQELSIKDKKKKLERKKQVINETNQVLANQQRTIQSAKDNVLNAMNIGCETKEEYSIVVTQMTQHQSTKSETQKAQIEQNISTFQQSKVEQKADSQNIDKPKVLKKTNNNQSNQTSSSGFANTITLALIVTFVIGIAVGIGYMLYKSTIGG